MSHREPLIVYATSGNRPSDALDTKREIRCAPRIEDERTGTIFSLLRSITSGSSVADQIEWNILGACSAHQRFSLQVQRNASCSKKQKITPDAIRRQQRKPKNIPDAIRRQIKPCVTSRSRNRSNCDQTIRWTKNGRDTIRKEAKRPLPDNCTRILHSRRRSWLGSAF